MLTYNPFFFLASTPENPIVIDDNDELGDQDIPESELHKFIRSAAEVNVLAGDDEEEEEEPAPKERRNKKRGSKKKKEDKGKQQATENPGMIEYFCTWRFYVTFAG